MQTEVKNIQDRIKFYVQNPNQKDQNELIVSLKNLCKNHDSLKSFRIRPFCKLLCMICQKYINPEMKQSYYKFDCSCYSTCHIQCLKEKAQTLTNGFLNDETSLAKIVCSECKQQKISLRLYEHQIFGKDEYARIINEAVKKIDENLKIEDKTIYEINKIKEIECSNILCKKKILIQEIVSLDCIHKFCQPCTKALIEEQIDSEQADPVKCPIKGCLVEINTFTIQKYCDEKKYDKYDLKLIRANIGEENFISCTNCGEFFFNENGRSIKPGFVCSNCKK